MPQTRFMKGPLFAPHRLSRQGRAITDVPVARGVIDEEDYLSYGASKARLRKAQLLQKKCDADKPAQCEDER